jgi:hypothetical protein
MILTPSHQWPTGAVLSAESRTAALRWAKRRGALIVEDDYDAEYRYDRSPIGAMQGLAPDQVVYAGTASKTLAPGLRLGWLLVPRHLVGDVAAAKILADRGSPAIDQLTFADFLSRGKFDRHLRRMRPTYRRRRDTLLNALRERVPDLEPAGVAAGLHLVTWLPGDLDEAAVVEAAARMGLGVYGIAPYRISSDGGLIFGYATLDERAIVEGVAMLAEVIAVIRSARGPVALVAGERARVREQAARRVAHELVVDAVRVKHQSQHTVRVVVAHEAVRLNSQEPGEERAAGAREYLGDAVCRVELPCWVLGRETLIPVHVPDQVDIGPAVVHVLNQLVDFRGGEARRSPLRMV